MTVSTTDRPTAATDWRALGTGVRLVATDPALLNSCNLFLACSRFRVDPALSALNAAEGRPVKVSSLPAEALEVALRASRATDGAVDPTVGSAMEALGHDHDFTLVQEDDRPVRLTVQLVPGWSLVELDRATNRVTLPPGISLDLGATARSWAGDKAAHMPARAADCGILPTARTPRSASAAVVSPPPAPPPAAGAEATDTSTTWSTPAQAPPPPLPGAPSQWPPPPVPRPTRRAQPPW